MWIRAYLEAGKTGCDVRDLSLGSLAAVLLDMNLGARRGAEGGRVSFYGAGVG